MLNMTEFDRRIDLWSLSRVEGVQEQYPTQIGLTGEPANCRLFAYHCALTRKQTASYGRDYLVDRDGIWQGVLEVFSNGSTQLILDRQWVEQEFTDYEGVSL